MDRRSAPGSRAVPVLWVILLYALLEVAFAYPLSMHPWDTALRIGSDTDLYTWTLAWDAHAFLHRPLSIFDANIFYPAPNTLAFSENLIGAAFISAPVQWITGNPVLALNFAALSSGVLSGLGGYVLGRALGMSRLAAFLSGLIYAFGPPRFLRLGQLHLTTVQWIPFGLASLHRYLDGGRRRDLWMAVGFFTLQVLSSGHGAAFMAVAYVALLIYRVALGDEVAPFRRLRDFGMPGLLLVLPIVFAVLPYRSVQQEGLRRTLDDWTATFESLLASPSHLHQYLISLVPGLRINQRGKAYLFPGVLPVLLAAIALWPRWRRAPVEAIVAGTTSVVAVRASWRERCQRGMAVVLDLIALVSLVTGVFVAIGGPLRIRWAGAPVFSAAGPWRLWLAASAALGIRLGIRRWVPLDPHQPVVVMKRLQVIWRAVVLRVQAWRATHRQSPSLFYGLLALIAFLMTTPRPLTLWPYVYSWPGFNFIRVPSRFAMLGLMCVGVLAGLGFDRLFARRRRAWRAVAAGLAAGVLVAEYATMPLTNTLPYTIDIPAIDQWLDTRPKPFSVAEVPVLPHVRESDAARYEKRQSVYMTHSMAHWQKTIHGSSGFRLLLHDRLNAELSTFPNRTALESLVQIHVTYLVVHTDLYQTGEWAQVEPRFAEFAEWMTLEHVEGAGRVYSLHRPRQE
ncbi:MAG TPA: hypothetical protein VGK32_19960 [Vicinamibacterales bacterium]|jgi:hypothetical protein